MPKEKINEVNEVAVVAELKESFPDAYSTYSAHDGINSPLAWIVFLVEQIDSIWDLTADNLVHRFFIQQCNKHLSPSMWQRRGQGVIDIFISLSAEHQLQFAKKFQTQFTKLLTTKDFWAIQPSRTFTFGQTKPANTRAAMAYVLAETDRASFDGILDVRNMSRMLETDDKEIQQKLLLLCEQELRKNTFDFNEHCQLNVSARKRVAGYLNVILQQLHPETLQQFCELFHSEMLEFLQQEPIQIKNYYPKRCVLDVVFTDPSSFGTVLLNENKRKIILNHFEDHLFSFPKLKMRYLVESLKERPQEEIIAYFEKHQEALQQRINNYSDSALFDETLLENSNILFAVLKVIIQRWDEAHFNQLFDKKSWGHYHTENITPMIMRFSNVEKQTGLLDLLKQRTEVTSLCACLSIMKKREEVEAQQKYLTTISPIIVDTCPTVDRIYTLYRYCLEDARSIFDEVLATKFDSLCQKIKSVDDLPYLFAIVKEQKMQDRFLEYAFDNNMKDIMSYLPKVLATRSPIEIEAYFKDYKDFLQNKIQNKKDLSQLLYKFTTGRERFSNKPTEKPSNRHTVLQAIIKHWDKEAISRFFDDDSRLSNMHAFISIYADDDTFMLLLENFSDEELVAKVETAKDLQILLKNSNDQRNLLPLLNLKGLIGSEAEAWQAFHAIPESKRTLFVKKLVEEVGLETLLPKNSDGRDWPSLFNMAKKVGNRTVCAEILASSVTAGPTAQLTLLSEANSTAITKFLEQEHTITARTKNCFNLFHSSQPVKTTLKGYISALLAKKNDTSALIKARSILSVLAAKAAGLARQDQEEPPLSLYDDENFIKNLTLAVDKPRGFTKKKAAPYSGRQLAKQISELVIDHPICLRHCAGSVVRQDCRKKL